MNKSYFKNTVGGFSLVEMLVYLGSMTVVLLTLSYVMLNVYGFYSSTLNAARADRAAGTLMQVLATEMRSGAAIDQSESIFNSPQGQLTIQTESGLEESEKTFYLENDRVVMSTEDADTLMTPEDILVSKFLFTQIITPISYAVRYEMDLTYPIKGGELVTKTYSGLVILRRSYE
jgi:Tfp pilus assembly protein PilV